MLKFLTIILSFASLSLSQIVISEFQYAPADGEPEWVELFNNSTNSTEISGYKLGDSKNFTTIPDIDIPPYSYVVITKDQEFLIDKYDLPAESLVLSASLPALNNGGDELRLFDDSENLIDSIYYEGSWGEPGKSLERVDFDKFADKENLKTTMSPKGGTPTLVNTHKVIANDIELEYVIRLDTTLVFKVINRGKNDVNEFDLDFRVDINRNGYYSEMESVISEYQGFIAVDSSELFSYNLNEVFKDIDIFGSFNSIAYVTLTDDENHKNDTIHYELILPALPNSILINEIMYDVNEESGEFIELYNNSNFVLNLKSWEIFDKAMWDKSDGVSIVDDVILMPREFMLLAWDENLYKHFAGLEFDESVYILSKNISLNKTEDLILITDPDRKVIDSVTYFDDWHSEFVLETQNRSLEKIKNNLPSSERSNWLTCSDQKGATPLQENSFNNKLSNEFGLEARPNPFYITSKNFQGNNCSISYNLPYISSIINIFVYDQNGNLISRIYQGKNASSSGIYLWNGSDENGKLLQTGPYVLYLEATDQNSGDTYSDKILVVIGNQ